MISPRIYRLLFPLSLLLIVLSARGLRADEAAPKYLDPNLPIEQRIDDLLPRMTVEEKILQVSDDWGSKGVPRLRIPPLLKTEGVHSQSYSLGATLFPEPIAMASTFDLDLVGSVGKQTAVEAKAAHIRSSWSPVLDVARDVRWGRVEETYGEDPYLVSRMGVSWIDAFQGEGLIAVPKHFVGQGEMAGGRDSNDLGLSERIMREIHLPSFRAAVEEAHAGGVMASYGVWQGVPDNASTYLLQTILRQEWGFDGYVVSDCDALNHFTKKYAIVHNPEEAALLGIKAGVDMECGAIYRQNIPQMIQEGMITEADLDSIVRPVLRAKFKLGLFEHPGPADIDWKKLPEYDTPDSRALTRQVEDEAIVLLKNEKNLLPLSKDIKTIAVIGPNADEVQTGDYSSHLSPNQVVTVLQGIKSHVGPNTKVVYAAGCAGPLSMDKSQFDAAVAAAKQADVAVVVVGDNSHPDGPKEPDTTGENNDGATLDFPGVQRDLIKAVQATGTPVVLVLVNGKPFTLDWEAENIPAILVTWYPGEEGGDATADVLFGDRNPSGHLPVTWPRSVGQLPLQYDSFPSGRGYKYYDMPFEPQYRFGFGLSYTQFKYSNLVITPKADDPGFVTVTADVENVGPVDGEDVVQLYITDLIAPVETRTLELEGFQRVALKKGEKKTVSFNLTPYQLSFLDTDMVRRVQAGTFRIHVGDVSPMPPNGGDDHKLHIRFDNPNEGISAEFQEPKDYAPQFSYALETAASATAGSPTPVTLTVKNNGNLEDVTNVKLFSGQVLDSWGFELQPGESKSHTFQPILFNTGQVEVAAVTPFQMVSKTVAVSPAPARVELTHVLTRVDADATLDISAVAQNVGSDAYSGNLVLKVDGTVGTQKPLQLQPGEKQNVALTYAFTLGGLHKIQVNDLPEQEVVVNDGLALALQNPVVYLKLDENSGSQTKNEITGAMFPISGSPAWVPGKSGSALHLENSTMDIATGNIELYRKSFTLSAWIKINQLGKGGDLALFGGSAPMGADQDNDGTNLHVGLQNGKLFFGFLGRDIAGTEAVPLNDWENVTYAYDAATEKGSLYLNGKREVELPQKPYVGPLQSVGNCAYFDHGDYLIDQAVVTQSCLTSPVVKVLVDQGLEALRQGDFVSGWVAASSTYNTMQATTDLPAGTHISVTVEAGDGSGKVLGGATVELAASQQSYTLPNLPAGQQIRLRAQLSSTVWGATPVLRAVTVSGSGASQHWNTPADWKQGTASPSLTTNFGEP